MTAVLVHVCILLVIPPLAYVTHRRWLRQAPRWYEAVDAREEYDLSLLEEHRALKHMRDDYFVLIFAAMIWIAVLISLLYRLF